MFNINPGQLMPEAAEGEDLLESSAALLGQFGCCLVGRSERAPSIMQNVTVATAWQPQQLSHPVREIERARKMRGRGRVCEERKTWV